MSKQRLPWLNPRTGQPLRLSDPEIAWTVRLEMARMEGNPKLALEYLIKHGFLTKSGRLPKRYGGK